ncbi:MAG: hypothetical protein V7K35_28605 [Nostoc sp.]|uniref:hypothetical protein n=1 Tax=Nostoc sp. TaxID=1180 RepID=UPI002FF4FE0E
MIKLRHKKPFHPVPSPLLYQFCGSTSDRAVNNSRASNPVIVQYGSVKAQSHVN